MFCAIEVLAEIRLGQKRCLKEMVSVRQIVSHELQAFVQRYRADSCVARITGTEMREVGGGLGRELRILVPPPDAAGDGWLFTRAMAVSAQPGLWPSPSPVRCRSRAIRSWNVLGLEDEFSSSAGGTAAPPPMHHPANRLPDSPF